MNPLSHNRSVHPSRASYIRYCLLGFYFSYTGSCIWPGRNFFTSLHVSKKYTFSLTVIRKNWIVKCTLIKPSFSHPEIFVLFLSPFMKCIFKKKNNLVWYVNNYLFSRVIYDNKSLDNICGTNSFSHSFSLLNADWENVCLVWHFLSYHFSCAFLWTFLLWVDVSYEHNDAYCREMC